MRRAAILSALMLLAPAVVAGLGAAQPSGGDGGDGQQGNDTNQTGSNGTNDSDGGGQDGDRNRTGDRGGDRGPPASAQERREQARDRARQAGLFAQFSYQDGTAEGHFVAFNLSEENASVTDFRLKHNGSSQAVFSEVSPGNFSSASPARVAGSQLMLNGEDLRLQAHDNPTGLLRYTSTGNDTTVTFDLAEDAEAGEVKNETRVNVDAGDRSGTIILAANGTLSADNGTVTAQLDDPGTVLFRALPAGGSPAERKQARALGDALAEGKLGASVSVAGVNGTPATDRADFGVNASAREATDGRMRVELSANQTEGKIVNVAVDKGTINVSEPDAAVVQLDGENVTVEPEIDDVVNASGDTPRAHVLVTNSTVEVTVFVPSFSIHSLVTKDDTTVPDLPTPTSVDNPSGATVSTAMQARQQVQSRAQTFQGLSDQAVEQASQAAQDARVFGTFEVSAGGQAAGAFVDVGVDASAGQLTDVAVTDAGSEVPVYDAVKLDPYTKAADAVDAGPSVALIGQQATAIAHDVPTGALEVKAGSQSVTVTHELADGVSTERVGDAHIKLTAQGQHVHLLLAGGNGEFSLEGDRIRLALGANAQAVSLLHPSEASAAASDLHERIDAIKQGGYGAALSVADAGGEALETAQSYSVEAKTTAIETGRSVTATVSSQAPEPRVVSLELPQETVGASAAADVTVTLDGREIDTSASASQVLENAGSSQTQASVTTEAGAIQVLVNVPGFSDHDLTVQSTDDDAGGGGSGGTNDTGGGGSGGTDDEPEETPAPGVLVLVSLVGLAAALMAVRRER